MTTVFLSSNNRVPYTPPPSPCPCSSLTHAPGQYKTTNKCFMEVFMRRVGVWQVVWSLITQFKNHCDFSSDLRPDKPGKKWTFPHVDPIQVTETDHSPPCHSGKEDWTGYHGFTKSWRSSIKKAFFCNIYILFIITEKGGWWRMCPICLHWFWRLNIKINVKIKYKNNVKINKKKRIQRCMGV